MIQVGIFYRDLRNGKKLCVVCSISQKFYTYHPETGTYTKNGPVRVEVCDEFDSYGPLWHSEYVAVDEFVERFVPVDYDQLPPEVLDYDWVDAEAYTDFPKKVE